MSEWMNELFLCQQILVEQFVCFGEDIPSAGNNMIYGTISIANIYKGLNKCISA